MRFLKVVSNGVAFDGMFWSVLIGFLQRVLALVGAQSLNRIVLDKVMAAETDEGGPQASNISDRVL